MGSPRLSLPILYWHIYIYWAETSATERKLSNTLHSALSTLAKQHPLLGVLSSTWFHLVTKESFTGLSPFMAGLIQGTRAGSGHSCHNHPVHWAFSLPLLREQLHTVQLSPGPPRTWALRGCWLVTPLCADSIDSIHFLSLGLDLIVPLVCSCSSRGEVNRSEGMWSVPVIDIISQKCTKKENSRVHA